MTDTAVLSVQDAIATAISQGANPPWGVGPTGENQPILGTRRLYRDTAPATAAPGYFLIGSASESEAGFHNGQAGQVGRYRIHCWATTSANAVRLYQWLKDLIHERMLFLADNTMLRGQLAMTTTQSDTDGKAWQVVADYTVESLEA